MRLRVFTLLLAASWLAGCGVRAAVASLDEMRTKDQWFKEHLSAPQPAVPFSFVYGGKKSDADLGSWTKATSVQTLDPDRIQHTFTWTDRQTGLEARCVAIDYRDLPAVEWLLSFKNTGPEDSPILESIQALDVPVAGTGQGFILHHAPGDGNSALSFAPLDEAIVPGDARERVFAPKGGRSSQGQMPYFNVDWHGGGVTLAIGWSGQWEAGFQPLPGGGLRLRAGQQLTHFKLHAGESVRSPRIVLTFWRGEDLRGRRALSMRHESVSHTATHWASGSARNSGMFE